MFGEISSDLLPTSSIPCYWINIHNAFTLVDFSEMRFLCGQFKAGSKRKLGAMAQSSVTVQKKLLSDNIDNLPSTGDGSKMDAALTEV